MADEASKPPAISIGVIGCGTIASAVVTGLAKAQQEATIGSNAKVEEGHPSYKILRILLSVRSAKKSAALQESFPDLVL